MQNLTVNERLPQARRLKQKLLSGAVYPTTTLATAGPTDHRELWRIQMRRPLSASA